MSYGKQHSRKSAHEYKNTYYDKKSSEHGHYEPKKGPMRHGGDGSMARVTHMTWVEDNRDFSPKTSAPTPETKSEPAKAPTPIEYSSEIQEAKERVNNFKTNMDGTQGSSFSTDNPPETEAKDQGLTNKYKLNLIEQAVPGS